MHKTKKKGSRDSASRNYKASLSAPIVVSLIQDVLGVGDSQAAVRSRDLQQIDGFNGDDLKALREVKMAKQLGRERERERVSL